MSVHDAAFSPGLARFGDVAVSLAVELGRTELPLRDVLALSEGSVVALNRLTDELLDVTANGRVIARGEVVAQNGRFGLRIVSLVGEDARAAAPRTAPAMSSAMSPAVPPTTAPPAAAPPMPEPAAPAAAQPATSDDPLASALDDMFGKDPAA